MLPALAQQSLTWDPTFRRHRTFRWHRTIRRHRTGTKTGKPSGPSSFRSIIHTDPRYFPSAHHRSRLVSAADPTNAAHCATARASVFLTLPRPPYATTYGIWGWDRATRRATRLANDAFWIRKGA